MSSCKFCEDYASHVNIREFKRKHPEIYGAQLEYEIAVVMLIRSWIPGRKRNCGSTTDYRYRGCGFALNFCPECGKRLKKHKKAKEGGECGTKHGCTAILTDRTDAQLVPQRLRIRATSAPTAGQ